MRASLGDAEGARADIAAVREAESALVQPLGRAALAEAMLLERAGDRAALRELLLERRDVLLEGTGRRERAIVRAYQRMVKVAATSPYRQSGKREEAASEEPALVDWVARVAPGAAAFVRAPAPSRGGEPVPAAIPTEEARRSVEEARQNGAPGVRVRRARDLAVRLAAVVVLTGAIFAGLDALQGHTPHTGGGDAALDWTFDALGLVVVSLVLGGGAVLGATIADAQRSSRRILQIVSRMITQPERAEADSVALKRSRYALVRAQAHLYLAMLADGRGDPGGTLEQSTRGLGEVAGRATRDVAGRIITPSLSAERAFGLAAADCFDEAEAEVASIHAHFPLLALARFRVRLLSLVRQGDLGAAKRFVEQETHDLPLSPRDELLADAVRVAVAPHTCGAAEVLRVKEDLRVASFRRWMTAFAPSLIEAVEHAPEDDGEGAAREEAEAAREEAALTEAAAAGEARAVRT